MCSGAGTRRTPHPSRLRRRAGSAGPLTGPGGGCPVAAPPDGERIGPRGTRPCRPASRRGRTARRGSGPPAAAAISEAHHRTMFPVSCFNVSDGAAADPFAHPRWRRTARWCCGVRGGQGSPRFRNAHDAVRHTATRKPVAAHSDRESPTCDPQPQTHRRADDRGQGWPRAAAGSGPAVAVRRAVARVIPQSLSSAAGISSTGLSCDYVPETAEVGRSVHPMATLRSG